MADIRSETSPKSTDSKNNELGKIPEGWRSHKLGNLLIQEIRAVPLPEGKFKGLGIRSHGKGTFLKEDFESSKLMMDTLYKVCKDDLIVNITFAWEGAIAIAGCDDDGALVSHRFPTYSIKQELTLPAFLKYKIVEKDFVQRLGVISPGGAGRNRVLNKRDFLKLEMVLPPLPEQKKIAEVLSSVDSSIQAVNAVIEQAKRLKKGLLQELLTKGIGHSRFKDTEIGRIPEEWEVKRLGDTGIWKGGGTPSKSNPSYWSGGTIPWASSQEIKEIVLTRTTYKITEKALNESTANLIPTDSLLMVLRSGILRHTFPVALTSFPVAINQDIKALIPNKESDPRFLLELLQSKGKDILKYCSKAGTTVESIEFEWLKSLPIPFPSLVEQKRIAEILFGIEAVIESNTAQLQAVKHLKSGLLQDLLTGRVRVTV